MTDLVGKHVYTHRGRRKPGTGFFNRYSSTAVNQTAIIRCLVMQETEDEVFVKSEGNGLEFDDQYARLSKNSLILMPGSPDHRVEEIHSMPEDWQLGEWKDCPC